jgi:hypothetical protein
MAKAESTKELAFYYPNPMWYSGDWVKNLILFWRGRHRLKSVLPGAARRRLQSRSRAANPKA